MVSSGQPIMEYIDSAVRHVLLRQVRSSDLCLLFIHVFDRIDFIFHHSDQQIFNFCLFLVQGLVSRLRLCSTGSFSKTWAQLRQLYLIMLWLTCPWIWRCCTSTQRVWRIQTTNCRGAAFACTYASTCLKLNQTQDQKPMWSSEFPCRER